MEARSKQLTVPAEVPAILLTIQNQGSIGSPIHPHRGRSHDAHRGLTAIANNHYQRMENPCTLFMFAPTFTRRELVRLNWVWCAFVLAVCDKRSR